MLLPFYLFIFRDLKWAGGANAAGFVDPGQFSPAVRFILVISYNVTRFLCCATSLPSLVVMGTYLIRCVNALTYFIEYWGCEMIKTMAEQETDEEQAYSPFETRCQDLYEELMGANELMNHAFGIAGTILILTMILLTFFFIGRALIVRTRHVLRLICSTVLFGVFSHLFSLSSSAP